MDVDEDDDFYAPEPKDSIPDPTEEPQKLEEAPTINAEQADGDLEEGEEEEEGSEGSDSVWTLATLGGNGLIIVLGHRYYYRTKGWRQSRTPSRVCMLSIPIRSILTFFSQPRYNDIRNIPQRTITSEQASKPAAKKEKAVKDKPQPSGAHLPGLSTSTIDINAKPVYEPAGKPITQVNIDEGMGAPLTRRSV